MTALSIIICLLPCLQLIKPLKLALNGSANNFFSTFKYEIIMTVILIIGFAVRVIGIQYFPRGFNQDEASLAYDAWAVLNYGVDRNLHSLPLYFKSWGSGQNAIYAYLSMPFIAMFGLNEFSARISMAIVGCITLVVAKKLFETVKGKTFAFWGVLFFAIAPWHIIKSRWCLESNLFPDLVFYGVSCYIISLTNSKRGLFYLGSVLLGLSAYAYGTSYFFLPLFCLVFFGYLMAKRQLTPINCVINFAIIGLVSLPIILFVLVNTFGMTPVDLPIFSIPVLCGNRQASLVNTDNIASNLNMALRIIFSQTDGLPWNSMNFFGLTYVITLPFMFVPLLRKARQWDMLDKAFAIWFMVSFAMSLILADNINRLNIIIIPMIYFTVLGIYTFISWCKKSRAVQTVILSLLLTLFAFFGYAYCTDYQEQVSVHFFEGMGSAITSFDESKFDYLVIDAYAPAPYLYTLYYTQTSPYEFQATQENTDENSAFINYTAFSYYIQENLLADYNPVLLPKRLYLTTAENAENLSQLNDNLNVIYYENFATISVN